MILEYIAGFFFVVFSIPQAFIIGLLRGAANQYSQTLETSLRLILDAFLGVLTFVFINQIWLWLFDSPIPTLFLVASLLWDFFFVDRDKLVLAAPMNQVATDLGTVIFLIGSLALTDFIWLPE